jgi:hypothetical protein
LIESTPTSIQDAVRKASDYLRNAIFGQRQVRVGYSEKRNHAEFGPRLETAYFFENDATHNAHHYPLSIAGWALAEGSIIEWPADRQRRCDFGRIEALSKLEGLDELVSKDRLVNAPPYLGKSHSVSVIQDGFFERSLTLDGFYLDFSGSSPSQRYFQFLSLPVPLLAGTDRPRPERGVFNVDTYEEVPLLNTETLDGLCRVSQYVEDAYLNS